MIIYLSMFDTEAEKTKFEQLYLTYRNLMFYTAQTILCNEKVAEDAVHQAFINIIENFEKVSDIVSPKTRCYVTVIVRNVSINLYNRQKKSNMIYFEDLDYNEDNEDNEVPGSAEPMNELETADILKALPKQYGDILLLKYHYGYQENEIAELLNITPENARKRVQRAKKCLSKLLTEREGA